MNRFGLYTRSALCAALFVPTAMAQSTTRVSVASTTAQGDDRSGGATLSADARYVAFWSDASNLVPGDTNGVTDCFVHDRQTGQTTRVSVSSAGVQGNSFTALWSFITSDGRYVAFSSSASNLVPGDTNGDYDAFVHDRQTATTSRVSVSSTGAEANESCGRPVLSDDGRYVAFYSRASTLVAGDTNNTEDSFVHDRQTGVTERVSVHTSGAQGNSSSYMTSISADGRYVSFESFASSLVTGDTNGSRDVFVHDRQTGTTSRVSVSSLGAQGTSGSQGGSMSADGRYVTFDSNSAFVPGDIPGQSVFVHDRQTATTSVVSVSSSGMQVGGVSFAESISDDGRYVAFSSSADTLVAGDTNTFYDAFVHDRMTGTTSRVSLDSSGAQANDDSYPSAITADGRYVAFRSSADSLVAGDTNGFEDTFIRDRSANAPVGFCFGDGSLLTACPCVPPNVVPNPSATPGHGCANSFDLGGALLTATGDTSPDTMHFVAWIGASYAGFGFLVKGNAELVSGVAVSDGVRCAGGALVRFGGHNAATNGAPAGFWTYPNVVQTTPVSLATLQAPAQAAYYQLYYRNATASFCNSSTANLSNGVRILWP